MPGILAWVVRGAVEWASDGLQVPERLSVQRDERRDDSDQLSDFAAICLKMGGTAVTPAADLYKSYKIFCELNGDTPVSTTASV